MPWAWAATPPEINHALLSGGDQAATLADSSAALTELSTVMVTDAATMAANAGATADVFVGAGGAAAAAAAAAYEPLASLASGWLAAGAATVGTLTTSYHAARDAMVPAEVALATRESAEAWAAANWHGFFTPIVTSLYELYGNQWAINGSAGSGWETAVFAASGPLTVPAPLAPLMASPVGMAAEAGEVGAQAGSVMASSSSMGQGFQGLQAAATASPSQAGSPGGTQPGALSELMSAAQGPMSAASSLPSSLVEPFGSLPQTLGSMPAQGFGLLGPLLSGSGLQAANPANALAAATEAAKQAAAAGTVTGAGPIGGGGIAGIGSGLTAPMSSLERPSSGFGSQRRGSAPSSAAGTAVSGSRPTAGMAGTGMLAPPPAARDRKSATNGAQESSPVNIEFDPAHSDYVNR